MSRRPPLRRVETTANALAWAVERLVHHPEKLDRLTEDTVAADEDFRQEFATRQRAVRARLVKLHERWSKDIPVEPPLPLVDIAAMTYRRWRWAGSTRGAGRG